MEEKIISILAEVAGVPAESIGVDTRLIADLGLSSFDVADAAVMVEQEYGIRIPDERFQEMETVADVLRIAVEVSG
ncbi:MAG: acyl carrier protein [Mogibacterium sp.]|nr:acyl carrier protein [Mogibacterium sp.]